MNAPVDPRVLNKTREEVRDAHQDLVAPQRRSYMREKIDPETGVVLGPDGVTRHVGLSLLNQLRQAVATGNERGARGRGTPLPISAEAHDLLGAITTKTMDMLRYFGTQPAGRDIEHNMREVVARCGLSDDLESILGVRGFLRAWVASIRAMFDPPKRIHLWGHTCPSCDAKVVWRLDESDGEEKQIAPLEVAFVETDAGERKIRDVHCLACEDEWLPSQLMWLGRLLGCEIDGVETGEPAA